MSKPYFIIKGRFGRYTIHYPSGQSMFYKTFIFKFFAKRYAIVNMGNYMIAMNQIRNKS